MTEETRTKMAEEELNVPEEAGRESARQEEQQTTAEARVKENQSLFKRPMLPAKWAAKTATAKAPWKAERAVAITSKPVETTENRPDNRRRLLRRQKRREAFKAIPKNYLPRAAYRCYQKPELDD